MPFQTLPSCVSSPGDRLTEGDDNPQLLKHADLNFDGFEDLELLVYYIPHLGKELYCIYLWDSKAEQFRYSKEFSNIAVNLEAHPENKTLKTHEDWQGGTWEESTYRWNDGKLELIEQNGLYGDWATQTDKKCGFEFNCNRLIKGEMITTLKKPVCTDKEMTHLPDCPAATQLVPNAPSKESAEAKKN